MAFDLLSDDVTLPNLLGKEAVARLEHRIAEVDIEFCRAYERLVNAGDIEDEKTDMLIIDYATQRFFALANEALKSRAATTSVRRIIESSLPIVIERAFSSKHRSASSACVEDQRRFHDMAQFIITHSDEWLELQKEMAGRAKLEQETLASLPMPETVIAISGVDVPGIGAATPMPATGRARRGRPMSKKNLHPEVDEFLDQVSKFARSADNPHVKLRRDITITDFCRVAGFADDTYFGAWRRGDSTRCQEPNARRFEATLKSSPREFLDRLSKRSQ